MADLNFIFAGEHAQDAADTFATLLAANEAWTPRRRPIAEAFDLERRVVDPISLASLIVSVPAAVLATMDLVDRMRKRNKARAMIDEAKRLKQELSVDTYVVLLDGSQRDIATFGEDDLLAVAAAIEKASEPS